MKDKKLDEIIKSINNEVFVRAAYCDKILRNNIYDNKVYLSNCDFKNIIIRTLHAENCKLR